MEEKKITTHYFSYNNTISVVSEPFICKFSKNQIKEFENLQKLVEQEKGIVTPNLNEMYIDILKVPPHDFNSKTPLIEARKWAEENLVGKYTSHIGTLEEFDYMISKTAIKKYIQSSSESDNISAHLSVLKSIKNVIDASIEVEIHADYKKERGVRSAESMVNKNVLVHRFYACVEILKRIYRIKITLLEYKQPDVFYNKLYSYEVIKIELLDESNSSILGAKVAVPFETSQLSVAKLLQNIEKSYDKGKFLLDESAN